MNREEAIQFAKKAQTMTDIPEVKEFYGIAETALRELAQPRRGKWLPYDHDVYGCRQIDSQCSLCGHVEYVAPERCKICGVNFCQNCGAEMEPYINKEKEN